MKMFHCVQCELRTVCRINDGKRIDSLLFGWNKETFDDRVTCTAEPDANNEHEEKSQRERERQRRKKKNFNSSEQRRRKKKYSENGCKWFAFSTNWMFDFKCDIITWICVRCNRRSFVRSTHRNDDDFPTKRKWLCVGFVSSLCGAVAVRASIFSESFFLVLGGAADCVMRVQGTRDSGEIAFIRFSVFLYLLPITVVPAQTPTRCTVWRTATLIHTNTPTINHKNDRHVRSFIHVLSVRCTTRRIIEVYFHGRWYCDDTNQMSVNERNREKN